MTDSAPGSAACHCGRPVHVYDEPGMEGFTRGLCSKCSTVRCDVAPGACATTGPRRCGMSDQPPGSVGDGQQDHITDSAACIVCHKPWPDEYGAARVHVGCALRWYWSRWKMRWRHR